MTDEQEAFMVEYDALCRRFGVILASCGCCSGVGLEARDWSVSEMTWQLDSDGSPYSVNTDGSKGFTIKDGNVVSVRDLA